MRVPAAPARSALAVAVVALVAGCAAAARIRNAAAPACRASLRGGFESILLAQHERPELAAELATTYSDTFARIDYGARPFEIASPSGAVYAFFFDASNGQCVLHLSGWQRDGVKHGDDESPVDSRPLASCVCSR